MKTKTKITGAKRHVTLELSVKKAEALADAITDNIVWYDTSVGEELSDLYQALYGNA